MNNLDVVVVGAIGIDTNIYLPGQDIDFEVEANFTENIDYVGQAGGYSSRGFAQLGNKTGFIGYLGQDGNGEVIRQALAEDEIQSLLFEDPVGTKRSVNFMYKDGRRKNFYDGKGSMEVSPDLEQCRDMLRGTKLIHVNIVNWARELLPIARELGIKISCDIQDIVELDDEYRQDFIKAADILFFSGVNFKDPGAVIEEFLKTNPNRIVIAGMGAEGCLVGTKDGIESYSAVEIAGPVVDTNGAGDGLAVGFLSSYFLDGYSLEDSILRGQITARYTCTQKASSSNLITKEKLDMFYQQLK